jgi:hypothetical protein
MDSSIVIWRIAAFSTYILLSALSRQYGYAARLLVPPRRVVLWLRADMRDHIRLSITISGPIVIEKPVVKSI